jgi:hypothetical protein
LNAPPNAGKDGVVRLQRKQPSRVIIDGRDHRVHPRGPAGTDELATQLIEARLKVIHRLSRLPRDADRTADDPSRSVAGPST